MRAKLVRELLNEESDLRVRARLTAEAIKKLRKKFGNFTANQLHDYMEENYWEPKLNKTDNNRGDLYAKILGLKPEEFNAVGGKVERIVDYHKAGGIFHKGIEIEEDINPGAMEKGKFVIEHPDKYKKML